MMEREEFHPSLKEYPKDFGNVEAEEMQLEFLKKEFRAIEKVEKASRFDDQRNATDFVVRLKNGALFALQGTLSSDPETHQYKVKQLLAKPVVDLHDDTGKVVERNVPRFVISEDKIKFGQAFNRAKEAGLESPYFAFNEEERKAITVKWLRQLLKEAETLKELFPKNRHLYEPIIESLGEELEEVKKEKRAA